MNTSATNLTTRHATVVDLVALLQAQHAAKLDVVVPARHLLAENGRLRLIGVGEPLLTPDGVTVGETVLRPTLTADAGIADKLGIPLPYLRRLRAEQVGHYDLNINTWLDRVAELVRAADVESVIDTPGGGVAVLLAGAPSEEPAWAFPWAVQSGPGRFGWDEPSLASTPDLRIGPDTADRDAAVVVRELGAVTEEQIAELVVTEIRRPLTRG